MLVATYSYSAKKLIQKQLSDYQYFVHRWKLYQQGALIVFHKKNTKSHKMLGDMTCQDQAQLLRCFIEIPFDVNHSFTGYQTN